MSDLRLNLITTANPEGALPHIYLKPHTHFQLKPDSLKQSKARGVKECQSIMGALAQKNLFTSDLLIHSCHTHEQNPNYSEKDQQFLDQKSYQRI